MGRAQKRKDKYHDDRTHQRTPDASHLRGDQERQEEVLAADRRSLGAQRAISYRAYQQIDSTQLGMAVVVQHMVAADAAGVLFTVNPVTGNDAEIVIRVIGDDAQADGNGGAQ